MRFQLRTNDVISLIKAKYGGVDDLDAAWASAEKKNAKTRQTVYRWLKQGLPSNADAVLGFCGALDVDPIAIVDFENSSVLANFSKIRLSFQLGRENLLPLRAIKDLLFPGKHWPPNDAAIQHFGRSWITKDFSHHADVVVNQYARIRITSEDNNGSAPRAFHIAYRRKGAVDQMWRPFGTLIQRPVEIVLLSESGALIQEPRMFDDFCFETFFGPGPADFRVACLHPFSLVVDFPSPQPELLRFVG